MSETEAQNSKSAGLSPLLVLFTLGAIAAVVVVVALSFINRDTTPSADEPDNTGVALVEEGAQSTGINPMEPKAIGDFSLIRADGTPLVRDDLKGKYTVVYFGYTYCPDFCPATMVDWMLISRALGDDVSRLNFVMISIDPARDTPEILTRYLAPFGDNIIGATGEDAVLRVMADEFGAFFETVQANSAPLYMLSHTASQFVMDPDGNLVTAYSFGTPVDVITADLRTKLAQ